MGQKETWIIVLEMPSGGQYAFGAREGNLALFPIKENGRFDEAVVHETSEDAEKAYNAIREQMVESGAKPFDEVVGARIGFFKVVQLQ